MELGELTDEEEEEAMANINKWYYDILHGGVKMDKETKKKMEEIKKKGEKKIAEIHKKTKGYITKNPKKVIGISIAAGIALGIAAGLKLAKKRK